MYSRVDTVALLITDTTSNCTSYNHNTTVFLGYYCPVLHVCISMSYSILEFLLEDTVSITYISMEGNEVVRMSLSISKDRPQIFPD